jgi:hypothetical protein
MYVEVKDLSGHVRRALEGVRYGRRDVELVAAESVELRTSASDGARGFVRAVNLDTGASRGAVGDWGGAGLGRRESDYTDERIEIPPNGAVIKGSMGYPRTYATIYAHPNAVGRFLGTGKEDELSDDEQQALYCFAAIKGGEYRRDEMRRRGVSADVVDGLVSRGYLKRNRAGATQITTAGKNARTIRN